MKYLLAQSNFDAVPADFIKWFFVIVFCLVLLACALYSAFGKREKQSMKIDKEDQPVETRKAAKRYNHDLAEERYQEMTRRLNRHDEEIKEIQKERAGALKSINRRFERVLIGLTAIGSRVGAKVPDENGGEEE